MLTILPHRFGNNDWRPFGNRMKYLDSRSLAIDKPMPLLLIKRVGSFYEKLFFLDRSDESFLHGCLSWLTHLIRGQSEIDVRDEIDSIHRLLRFTLAVCRLLRLISTGAQFQVPRPAASSVAST